MANISTMMRKELKDYIHRSNECADELKAHGYILWGSFNDPEHRVRVEKDGNMFVYKNYFEAHSHLIINKFHNGDLSFDIEKIESFDVPITVSKSFDNNLDYPFGIDVEDTSYWYPEQKERDEDFQKLKSMVPSLSFVEL